MDIVPKQTLYIKNLYEKIGKEELKKCLYCIFSQFGKIADVQCVKTNKLRGQAWIIFADINSASNALRCMNGFPFFEKNMEIQYAKDESVALTKTKEGWKPRKKQKTEKKAAAAKAAAQPAEQQPAKPGEANKNPPNKLLFIEGLPDNTTSQMLELLFNQFLGLSEVRMVESRPGIAFVEYDTEASATNAMTGLQSFQVSPGFNLRISYSK